MINKNEIRERLKDNHTKKILKEFNETLQDDNVIHLTEEAHKELKKYLRGKGYYV